jgi:GNAT superfamily N-acetyltransferase
MNLPVREMRAEDANEVARLCGQLSYPTTPEAVSKNFKLIRESGTQTVLVVEEQRVIGWIHVFSFLSLGTGLCAGLGGLVVDEAYRKKGIGKILMAAAEKWSIDQGLPKLLFSSRMIRKDAHRFYESLGYKVIKESYFFQKEF